MTDSMERHNELWRELPLQKPIPIPASFDGENAALYDLLDSLMEQVELIGEFDPAFAKRWCEGQLSVRSDKILDQIISDTWMWRGKAA